MAVKPPITSTTHTLPFDKLYPASSSGSACGS